ncbi:hypothetical protein BKG76_06765 [Mycobacteroides franklinii]|uniref:Uncharacterized protein n=1 Tax=Mycobacteroides franklinii TaxID=948102 RepID=A0A1S1LCY3_9MYCO|nr:hypothetical protein [Mycobacteroides franklinii]OHU28934.1 hypothetical protein BKG76_06765 [Mycobacteroides franklinii]
MSNIDDTNDAPGPDVNAQAADTDQPSLPESAPKARRTFGAPLKIAGAVSAVLAAVVLAFGAGVWAGSEFFEGHEHEHSESRSDDRDGAERHRDRDEHRFRDDRESGDRGQRSSAPSTATVTAPPTLPARP